MKSRIPLLAVFLVFLLSGLSAHAQYEYRFLFKGICCQTNASGNVIQIPITDQTLLLDRAPANDPSTVALVYHLNGDDKGDVVEVVSTSNGQRLALEFGFWFGSDASLQRTALTNATQTEQRRVDYIYTLDSANYISPNTHSSGAAFVTKRFLTDTNGVTRTTVDGTISWVVLPQGTNGTKVCTGTFSLGQPLF
jgi:hypothetical protein